MPTFDVSFKARYANGDEGRDTFKMDDQEDIGAGVAAAFSLFAGSELQEGRSNPVGLTVEANQR
jgi:hypothetical protein